MSSFTGSGAVYPFRAADTKEWTWALAESLRWEVRGLSVNFIVEIPAGFFTDLGSIPWWARWAINPADPQVAKAFILHDFMLAEFGPQCQVLAASQLYEALRALECPLWKRKLITLSVVFGIDNW